MKDDRKTKLIHDYILDEDDIYEEDEKDEDIDYDDDHFNTDDIYPDTLPKIKPRKSSHPSFKNPNKKDKETLYEMGFKANLINTIYNNMHPNDIQDALDFLNKNNKGKFTHSYLENDRFVCSICGEGRYAHESEALFIDNNRNDENNDLNNNINNDINISRNSNRFNRYENSYKYIINKKDLKYGINECGVCMDEITFNEYLNLKIKCGHIFCQDCWYNYLKEKINNANVAKITCIQHGCSTSIDEKFIENILKDDNELFQKYKKFLERKKILLSNKNIKFCPIPDCDGYAEKKDKNNKYVKCNFGHEFCFECLNKPHGDEKCENILEKEFEEWKSHKIVKRCPNCKIWTEKNEGCNHMTCVECKFQWCWLCQKEYKYGHYDNGSCKGLQFNKEQDEEKIKKMLEDNLKKYPPPPPPPPKKCQCLLNILKEIAILLIYLFLTPFNIFIDEYEPDMDNDISAGLYIFSVIPLLISYGLIIFTVDFIILLPGIFYWPYLRSLRRKYIKFIEW